MTNDIKNQNENIPLNAETLKGSNYEELVKQKQFFEAMFHNIPVAVVTLSLDNKIIASNPAFESLFGYREEEIIGKDLDRLVASDRYEEAVSNTLKVRNQETIHDLTQRNRKDGSTVDVELYGVPVMVGEKQIGMLGLYHDITERVKFERQLKHIATHDILTGLPNRLLFFDRMAHAIQLAKRQKKFLGILFFDLDGFKNVNDTYGHQVGDKVLISIADRLRTFSRESDTIARMGGDEFTFLMENLRQAQDGDKMVEKISSIIEEPISIDNHTVKISACIGMAIYPQDGEDSETLIKVADTNMYHKKEEKRRSG